jgi:hypothetical protein
MTLTDRRRKRRRARRKLAHWFLMRPAPQPWVHVRGCPCPTLRPSLPCVHTWGDPSSARPSEPTPATRATLGETRLTGLTRSPAGISVHSVESFVLDGRDLAAREAKVSLTGIGEVREIGRARRDYLLPLPLRDTPSAGLGRRRGPPCNLGIPLSDNLREGSGAVYHASPSKGGRGHETGAPAARIDNARALDSEAGFLECGVELFGC